MYFFGRTKRKFTSLWFLSEHSLLNSTLFLEKRSENLLLQLKSPLFSFLVALRISCYTEFVIFVYCWKIAGVFSFEMDSASVVLFFEYYSINHNLRNT
eukprot:snap_masked-scaffold_36-processed-gene-0.39-mRNA-1 protein AED:1.00 eAED:1.00 QI:0/0/0/0/1/1/2/0/97